MTTVAARTPYSAADPQAAVGAGNSGVDTKSCAGATFGNDGNSADVDTKFPDAGTFGNDGIGFIRVRKRKLKGGHSMWRAYRARNGMLASTSQSFDLVKAVRVNGKPRHKFVLGLGSQKDTATGRDAAYMLLLAVGRMKRHGFDESQRRVLLAELIRKGARRPTIAEVQDWNANSSWTPHGDELVAWLKAAELRL